jgi:hypothetical protein
MGGGKIAEFKVLTMPLGGKLLRCGPTKNANFPFVLLGRARLHHALVAGRTHATRGALEVDEAKAGGLRELAEGERKRLAAAFRAVVKAGDDFERSAEAAAGLSEVLRPILRADEG